MKIADLRYNGLMVQRPYRFWTHLFAGVGIVLLLVAWWVIQPKTPVPYAFLRGHDPDLVYVQGPGSWGPQEQRLYTIKRPYHSVVAELRSELKGMGFAEALEVSTSSPTAFWRSTPVYDGGPCGLHGEREVSLVRGRYHPEKEKYFVDDDPEWVTIVVSHDIEDSWDTVIRYTLFRRKF